MIFNVNIYRTWKKNRILKIKWNKYSIIQFPQCLLKRFPWKCFFVIHLFILLNSASLVRQGASHPPQRNPDISPHMLFIFIMFYIVISVLQKISCYHIVSPSVSRQYLLSVCSIFTSFDTQSNTSPTEFQGKSNTGSVHTCVYVTKSAGKWFCFWRTFKPASSSIWFFFNTFIIYFFLVSERKQSCKAPQSIPTCQHSHT